MARTDEAEATIRILGEDLVTGAAEKAEKSVNKVGKAAEEAKGPFGRLKDAMDAMGKSTLMTELNQGLEFAGKIGAAVGAVWDTIKEAASDRAVQHAFANTFGEGAESLERLQGAAQGLLADQSLRELANQGARAGLSLEQVSRLLESSTKAAVASGKDVAEQAASFLKSTVESNDEAVKQNGVLVDLAGAHATYAQRLGITADKLTGAQKAAASLEEITSKTNVAFGEMGGDETIARLTKLEVKWSNIKAEMREGLLAATVGLPETIQSIEDFQQSAQNQMLDAVTQGNYQKANIDKIITAMRIAGDVQEAYTLQIQLTARAAELLRQEEALLDKVYADHARELATLAAAEAARIKALQDLARKDSDAKLAAAAHAMELALVAQGMGDAEIAADKWKLALQATSNAHLSAVDNVEALYGAVRAGNSEIAKAIELQAELAAAMGDTAGADALRAQAVGILLGEGGTFKPLPPKGGSKGKSKLDSDLEQNAANTKAGQQQMADAQWEIRELAEQALADQHERAKAEDEARFQERLALLVQQHEEQQRILAESRSGGFDSLSDSILGLRDALGELDGISLDGLASAANKMGPLIDQFGALSNATDKSKGAMVSGTLGIVASSGKMVAGIIKDQRAQAVIMALVEQAEAWASFARYDYVGFGAHLASSAIWATVAGTSGGGGGKGGGAGAGGSAGGGRAAGAVPRVPNESPPDGPSFAPITLHISGGTYLGTDAEKTGRELAKMVDRHRGRSFRGGDAGSPP